MYTTVHDTGYTRQSYSDCCCLQKVTTVNEASLFVGVCRWTVVAAQGRVYIGTSKARSPEKTQRWVLFCGLLQPHEKSPGGRMSSSWNRLNLWQLPSLLALPRWKGIDCPVFRRFYKYTRLQMHLRGRVTCLRYLLFSRLWVLHSRDTMIRMGIGHTFSC